MNFLALSTDRITTESCKIKIHETHNHALKSLTLDRPLSVRQWIKHHKYSCFHVIGFKTNMLTT